MYSPVTSSPFSAGIHARLEKLLEVEEPVNPDPIIWNGYYVLGFYDARPKVGQVFTIYRYERNGVKAPGIMTTTEVTRITLDRPDEIEFETQNSRYRLTHLP